MESGHREKRVPLMGHVCSKREEVTNFRGTGAIKITGQLPNVTQ